MMKYVLNMYNKVILIKFALVKNNDHCYYQVLAEKCLYQITNINSI